MNELDNLKSKITYENKTIIGVVGLVIGFIFWGIGHPGIGIGDILILIFPAIFLIIPNETIKNSRALAIISIIIVGFLLLFGITQFLTIFGEYVPDSYLFPSGYVESMAISNILQIILAIYGLFCAFLLTIPTKPKKTGIPQFNNNKMQTNEIKYDKFCIECGQGLFNDSKFCPGCGTKLQHEYNSNSEEDSSSNDNDEIDEKYCSECGYEISKDLNFCPKCGKKLN